MAEVADLFATLGLKVDNASWARGDQKLGAFQDRLGRWHAANGRFLTMNEKAAMGLGAGIAKAGNEAEKAGRKAKESASGFDYLGASIKGYLAYLGGSFAYDKLIHANQEFEDRAISFAAIIQSNLGVSLEKAKEETADLNAEFLRFDMSGAPAKMSEIAEFGKNMSASVFAAKGNVKDLIEITEKGVIASKVLAGNRGAGYAALELSEMLMGQVSNRMQFQKLLLAQIHMTEDQFRELDEKQRIGVVKKALSAPGLTDAAREFADSFSGIETTVESKLEIMARKVGEKLFARLKESLKGFIAWMDENEDKLKELGDTISDTLVTAFNGLVKTIQFLAQHGSLLKGIMVALGAVMLATAVRAVIAWTAFLGPIGLIIAAIAGLAALAIEYWDDISGAAATAWDAIKKGFTAALNAIRDLPVIKQLIALADRYDSIVGRGRGGSATAALPPDASDEDKARAKQIDVTRGAMDTMLDNVPTVGPLWRAVSGLRGMLSPSAATSAVAPTVHVSMGDIQVNAPNADAGAVADQVNKTIGDHLSSLFRRTLDEVA